MSTFESEVISQSKSKHMKNNSTHINIVDKKTTMKIHPKNKISVLKSPPKFTHKYGNIVPNTIIYVI